MTTLELLKEKIESFKLNWHKDPIVLIDDDFIVLKLYKTQRDNDIFSEGKRNIIDEMVERDDFFKIIILNNDTLSDITKYISIDNFTLKKELREFSELQQIQKDNISLISNIPPNVDAMSTEILNISKYKNYLDHLNKVKLIKTKTSKIVKDKFNLDNDNVNTSAIFSNVGYIVKGFEGKYLSLSKGDRTFIKSFMDEQIKEGFYKITIKDTLPLYKESIKEIIGIGKELLKLTGNKTKLKSISRKLLGEERKSLESCWQLYFDKYLRMMLMNYKEFYSQAVFKKMPGYDKETRPDFLAVDIYNNIDVIEIKTHKAILFTKEKNRDSYYPSAELNKSIFQLNKYMDLKAENIKTSKIDNEYTKSLIENDKIYRPRGVLIISSRDHITAERTGEEISARLEKEIKKLKTTYNNIDIILFDELIKNLENYVDFLEVSLES